MDPKIQGLFYPLIREAEDFSNGNGEALLRSNVRKAIATRAASSDGFSLGEYPWRKNLGSQIERLRHGNYDEFLPDLIRLFAADAVLIWEPRASTHLIGTTLLHRDGGHLLRVSLGSGERASAATYVEVPI